MYKNSQAIFCLLLTALCALVMSSCISTTHRVVKAWGQSADEVFWTNELGGTTDCLYRVGNELYVQAYRSSGEVSMGGVRPWGDMWLGKWDSPGYDVTPHTDKAEKVWLRLVNTNRDEVYREFRYGSRHSPSEDICLHVSCKDALTQLPPDAVRLAMPRKRRVELYVVDGLAAGLNTEYRSARPSTYISADAHALYAYPLSAIMFVGVDVPVTLTSPIWLIPCICVSISQLYK